MPGDPTGMPPTAMPTTAGFSFSRLQIPKLAGFSGRALYLDADMQVLGDIADLWTLPFDEADVLYALTPAAHGRTRAQILRFFGAEDAQLGDADFDKHFDLKNLSSTAAAVLRHREVQRHLYELAQHYMNFHIRNGWLQAERRKVPSTADELEDFTGPALMLAHTLDEASKRSNRWTTS